MTKDRLLELKTGQVEIRGGLGNGNHSNNSSDQGKRKTKKKSSKKMKVTKKTMDEIFKETQQIRAWLEAIEEETKLVKRLHSVILHSTRPESDTKDKLMNSMIKIKTLSLRVRSSLKSLERQLEDSPSPVESRMVSVQHATLFKRFQTAMADFQAALAHHKDQTEELIKKQLRIAGSRVSSPEELEALLDSETTQIFVDNYVQETQAMKLALQDAKSRHKEMLELEKSIREIHELFADVATMVQRQGEMINVIEFNVEQGTAKVTTGNEEISQAYNKKKSARRKKMWCLICLMCVIGIVLVYAALYSLVTSIFTI